MRFYTFSKPIRLGKTYCVVFRPISPRQPIIDLINFILIAVVVIVVIAVIVVVSVVVVIVVIAVVVVVVVSVVVVIVVVAAVVVIVVCFCHIFSLYLTGRTMIAQIYIFF